ncbi:MAG: PIN domain-containing protein [Elusimicrobiota bacterium]
MKIYLDVCCLSRPFDDQFQDRIKIETDAILSILARCQTGKWKLVGSEVIDFEISKIPDDEKREKVSNVISIANFKILLNSEIEKRAIEISRLEFYSYDALHIACAERGKVDIMLTTDDSLLKKAMQNMNFLKVRIENPAKWLMGVI